MFSSFSFQVITEIVNPDFLLDDERPISSSETLDDCCSSLGDVTPLPRETSNPSDATVPSSEQNQQKDCDPSCHSNTKAVDLEGKVEGQVKSVESKKISKPSPITWKKCLERAPYADEESFSITDEGDYVSDNRESNPTCDTYI